MAVAATIYSGIKAHASGSATAGSASYDLNAPISHDMSSGVGANQADLIYAANRSLNASAVDALDLAGVLKDPFGTTVTAVKIKAVSIKAPVANPGTVTVGGAASNAFQGPFGGANHKLIIPPGGSVTIEAPQSGWAVTAGTGDILQVANDAAAPATYVIVIVGTSS